MLRLIILGLGLLAVWGWGTYHGDAYVKAERIIHLDMPYPKDDVYPYRHTPYAYKTEIVVTYDPVAGASEPIGTYLICMTLTLIMVTLLLHAPTPLEAFKTDALFSHIFDLNFLYPSVTYLQINTQLILVICLCLLYVFLVFCFLYNITLRNFILSSYLGLCLFLLSQLKFSMHELFISFLAILCVIGGFNVLGLIPLTGSFTAQIIINLSFTFSIIFGLVLIGFNMQGRDFLLTFIPSNVPSVMIPFLFIIEILSFFMRIFSMSIRLFSNMVAGHSLLHLLTEFVLFLMQLCAGKPFYLICSFVPLFVLYFWLFFELFVALLQGYVFVLLLLLYLNDLNKIH